MTQEETEIAHLRQEQAKIRDIQRDRMDEVHALCHEYWRNTRRIERGAEIPREQQDGIVNGIHDLVHLFMRGFDDAVIIHERMAEIEGRDPKEVARSLWPVRTRND